MKLVKICLSFLIIMGLGWACVSQAEPVFHNAQGTAVRFKNLQNKWLIINYWASWCDSCREEIPELNSFYKDNLDKNVVIYGVNYDQLAGSELTADIEKVGIAFPILKEDPGRQFMLGGLDVLPITFIINPKGNVAKKIMGTITKKELIDTLKLLQAEVTHASTT